MDRPSLTALHPALLPPGTVVGAWRVEDWAGRGVHGAVYRAVPLGKARAAPVALKLALRPDDPRFAREVELLSRCAHPSIPRLLDRGSWRSPVGSLHPFLVMQWVEGVPLYDQGRPHPGDAQRVRRWLAQLAQALAVVHAHGAVHRDLKGGNILVRSSDDRAMLMDFGMGFFAGAATLTPPLCFPGTHAYRSPESWLFELQFHSHASARFPAAPAEDLYALGVTACRLLTGEYPMPSEPSRDAHGTWHLERPRLPPALQSGSRLDPALRAAILRLLSLQPEERGTADQLATELEPRVPLRRMRRWLLPAAASLPLAVWAGWPVSREPREDSSVAQADPPRADSPDAGTAGLGEAATALAMEQAPSVSSEEGLSVDTPPEPQPGQVRPDEKGRCPRKGLVSLNGGCWAETTWEPETCMMLGGQVFKGTCYVPFIPREHGRSPTSDPAKKP